MSRNLCRICLRYCRNMVPLFKANIGEKQITDLIYQLFQIKFDPNAAYPRRVCDLCVKKIDYLYSFYEDLLKSQDLMKSLTNISRKEARKLIENEGPSNFSDGILEEAAVDECATNDNSEDEVLEPELLDSQPIKQQLHDPEAEQLGSELPHVEIEAVGFDDDRPVEEQLIDIKIEAVDEDDFIIEKLKDAYIKSDDDEEEFRGFEDPIPIKHTDDKYRPRLTIRKERHTVPKLDIVETIPNKCYICNEVLEDKDMFDLHLITHKNMLPYKCEDCSTNIAPVRIKTLILLNKHFESHGFNYLCEYCPLKFRSYPPLYDHTRNFHTKHKEGFNCDVCGQVFIEIRKFQTHVRAHRNQNSERYKCKTCGKNFQTGTILRRHERIHMDKPMFTCSFCERTFHNDEQYQKHKIRHLQQQQDQQNGYTCTQCEAHFTNKVDRRIHMLVHFPNNPNYGAHRDHLPESLKNSASYPRPCEEPDCKYVAPSYALMWSHYRNHYKLYHCQECKKKFATATILKNHIEVIHQKIRKYSCDKCPKTFAYAHKFKEHMNVHKGIKNHKCRFCGKTFTHCSNMLVHEKVHKNIKVHKCDICGSSYVTTSALKKHRKTHRTNVDAGLESALSVGIKGEHFVEKPEVQEQTEELIYYMENENEEVLGQQVEIAEEVVVKELYETLEEV